MVKTKLKSKFLLIQIKELWKHVLWALVITSVQDILGCNFHSKEGVQRAIAFKKQVKGKMFLSSN
jgi:hypothetical protein